MSDLEIFEQVCRAMSQPDFYPHRVFGLERRETHISVVFLTGDIVYKLKKPVDFGFLDYTSLETRRRMCELEVKLNQRLSSGVYLGVVPLSVQGGEVFIGERGRVVEYAVKMLQLSDDASLSNIIMSGRISTNQMLEIGERLAEFYSTAERGGQIDEYGRSQTIEFNSEENFRQLEPFLGSILDQERFSFIMEASRGFLRDRGSLFQHRIEDGRICDGHGDLRAEHVYFTDKIQIIDCIEFNERFRYGDAAVDLAYLHTDLERLGASKESLSVLNAYMASSMDYAIFTLLDFYSCYRSIVKVKISCLSAAGNENSQKKPMMLKRAAQYLDLAFRYAVQFARPTLFVLCGLPGTGKSTYAEKLHEMLSVALFRSDEVRKQLPQYKAHRGPLPFGAGVYRSEIRGHVYSMLLSIAHDELKNGRSTILDATFSIKKWREEAVRLAEDLDSNVLFLECVCSRETVLARLARRRAGADGQSDARPEHLGGFEDEFEAMEELPAELHIRVNTEAGVEENVRTILAGIYSKKRAQVERIIAKL